MSEPLISVIVPVYNAGAYLRECLDSLLAQTWEKLEIILVDDGSTDKSGAICDEYAERDARIRAIHIPNGGVSHARNIGIEAATGDYIGFVDSDDCISPDMYSLLLSAMESEPAKAAGVRAANAGVALFYDDSDRIVQMRGVSEWVRRKECTVGPSEIVRTFIADATNHYVCTKLYSREVFASGLRFKEGIFDEDSFFTFQFSLLMRDSGWAMVEIPGIHYWYRQHGGGTCGSRAVQMRTDRMANLEVVAGTVKDEPGLPELVEMQKARTLVYLLDDIMGSRELTGKHFRTYFSQLRAIPRELVKKACSRRDFKRYRKIVAAPHLRMLHLRMKGR